VILGALDLFYIYVNSLVPASPNLSFFFVSLADALQGFRHPAEVFRASVAELYITPYTCRRTVKFRFRPPVIAIVAVMRLGGSVKQKESDSGHVNRLLIDIPSGTRLELGPLMCNRPSTFLLP
jgi:hypothetical protein